MRSRFRDILFSSLSLFLLFYATKRRDAVDVNCVELHDRAIFRRYARSTLITAAE